MRVILHLMESLPCKGNLYENGQDLLKLLYQMLGIYKSPVVTVDLSNPLVEILKVLIKEAVSEM